MARPGGSSIDNVSSPTFVKAARSNRRVGRAVGEPPPNWRQLVPAVLFLLVSVVAMALLIAQPKRGQREVAIVLPPWESTLQAAALVQKAGGWLVDVGGLPNVYITAADRPGFVSALYRAGAWLVIDPISAHGCLSSSPRAQGF
jgi:hypothetical protein